MVHQKPLARVANAPLKVKVRCYYLHLFSTEVNVVDKSSAANTGPTKIIRSLHDNCSKVVIASCETKYNAYNAGSYGFANDLELWIQALSDRPESALFQTASSEFVLALLNNAQGQYRNAFKGLRLVLELVLQGAYLSVNPVLLSEWLRSQADTSWQAILDPDKGVFAVRYCRAFFPALADEVAPAKAMCQIESRSLKRLHLMDQLLNFGMRKYAQCI